MTHLLTTGMVILHIEKHRTFPLNSDHFLRRVQEMTRGPANMSSVHKLRRRSMHVLSKDIDLLSVCLPGCVDGRAYGSLSHYCLSVVLRFLLYVSI